MILYTVTGLAGAEGYLDIAKSGDLAGKNIYVNMTNKCPCNCTFCLRHTKEQLEGNSLWLKEGEPSPDQVLSEFAKYDLREVPEVVFCGFGEPTERIEDVVQVIDGVKKNYPEMKFRINTVGLGNMIHKKDITPLLEGRFDTVSISLNAPNAEEFFALTRSRFGIDSYEALKKFALLAKAHVPNVVMTVVDKVMSEEKIETCRKICEDLGVNLRVRPFEE